MRARIGRVLLATAVAAGCLAAGPATARASSNDNGGGAAEHWTAARLAAATPRDLVIDHRGLAYRRGRDGALVAHGHSTPAARPRVYAASASSSPTPMARPGGSGDVTGPTISAMSPADGATIGSSATFSATVTDPSGVRSVSVVIVYPGGTNTSSFSAARSGDVWSVTLNGFTDGEWGWRVVAKDAAKGGNTRTSSTLGFTVDTGGGGGGGGTGAIANEEWTAGGDVQTAAGRIYFEMPANAKRTRWNGYVCSGTVADDGTAQRSVIITAAHCVYDDVYKAFARNVIFIPNQAGSSSGTDLDCSNDPMGCWEPSFGVVDLDWTTRTFPDNVAWDYAYYVVPDSGAHKGAASSSAALDVAAGSLPVQVTAPSLDQVTHALGYSYSDDPNFMYCAEEMTTEGAVNWWLPSCGLSGGSSGGPWVQPMDLGQGAGPIISVNSWGYTTSPGMAGPKLSGTSAGCLFTDAKGADLGGADRIPAGC